MPIIMISNRARIYEQIIQYKCPLEEMREDTIAEQICDFVSFRNILSVSSFYRRYKAVSGSSVITRNFTSADLCEPIAPSCIYTSAVPK